MSTWSQQGSLTIASSGNIGVNTTVPSSTLTVNGSFNATSSTISNSSFTNISTGTINASTGITSGAINVTGLISTANLVSSTSTLPNSIFTNISTSTLIASNSINATFNSHTIGNIYMTNGSVGIGTVSPMSRLQVTSPAAATSIVISNVTSGSSKLELCIANSNAEFSLSARSGDSVIRTHTGANLIFQTSLSGSAHMTIVSTGSVGIGTIAPSSLLTVNGSFNATSSTIPNSSFTNISTGSINLTNLIATNSTITNMLFTNSTFTNLVNTNISTSSLIVSNSINASFNSHTLGNIYLTGGNVGCGGLPIAGLDIQNGGIKISSTNSVSQQGFWLQWNRLGLGESWLINQRGIGNGDIRFAVSDISNNITENMRLTDAGYLGIGVTTVPSILSLPINNTIGALTWGSGGVPYSAIYDNANLHLWTDDTMYFDIGSVGTIGSAINRLYIDSSGYIGISDTTPFTKLSTYQTTSGAGIRVRTANSTGNYHYTGYQFSIADVSVNTDNYVKGGIFFKDNNTTNARGDMYICVNNAGDNTNATPSNSALYIKSSGLIGIATTSPTNIMSIKGTIDISSTINIGCTSGAVGWAGALNVNGNDSAQSISLSLNTSGNKGLQIGVASAVGNFSTNAAAGDTIFRTPTGANMIFQTSGPGAANIYIASSGNFGVNNATPIANLHIIGNMYSGTVFSGGTGTIAKLLAYPKGVFNSNTNGWPRATATSVGNAICLSLRGGDDAVLDMGVNGASGSWIQSTNYTGYNQNYPLILNPNGGSVGINDTTPFTQLSVIRSGSGPTIRARSTFNGIGTYTGYQFSVADTTVSTDHYAKGGIFFKDNGIGNARGDMYICVNNGADNTNASASDSILYIKSTGFVGVNTTVPSNTLTVNGSFNAISSTISNSIFTNISSSSLYITNGLPYLSLQQNTSGTNYLSFGMAQSIAQLSSNAIAGDAVIRTNTGANMMFQTSGPGAANLYIASSGNIGVSNPSPSCALDVSGIIKNSGGIVTAMNTSDTACGQTSSLIKAMSSQLFSASSAGVPTGVVTPLFGSGTDYGCLYKSSSAQYDFWRTYINLVAGTYTFRLEYGTSTDRGIATVLLNGTSVGTIDTYSASNTHSLGTITGIVIGTSGTYKVELQVNTKNASSSNYYFIWNSGSFIRTA